MTQSIATVALVVRDYDEAIAYYTAVLGFILLEDTPLEDGKRWVLVRPPGAAGATVVASNKRDFRLAGHSLGLRVMSPVD